MNLRRLLLAPLVLGCTGNATPDTPATRSADTTPANITLTPQQSGTDALLQAVSVVNESVVWVSGHRGTVLRTTDGGGTWERIVVPGADSLQFRDVHASSAREAWLLSAGPGDVSRVYHTSNGGSSWRLVHQNPDSAGFYDCLDFWGDGTGVLYGDEVDGSLVVLRSADGRSWNRIPPSSLPPAQEAEGGFAASGTCVLTAPDGHGWIGTGNAERARLLRTSDGGMTWAASDVPIAAGEGAGIAALARDTAGVLYALGGDIGNAEAEPAPIAVSEDDGDTWTQAGAPPLSGAVYGAAASPAHPGTLVAVNPRGLAVSHDGGATWELKSSERFWAVAFAENGIGWAVGPAGAILMLR